jgi:hypothetical protein
MSDSDRCPDGYQYISTIKACCLEFDADSNPVEWDGKRCEAVLPEDTNVDTSTSEPPEGLGDPCTEDGNECEGKEANFCVVNPLAPDKAYCTTIDCSPGGCQAGYQCCDCSAATLIPKEQACLNDADAATTVEYKQCTCEG